jgi:hypothetical protein
MRHDEHSLAGRSGHAEDVGAAESGLDLPCNRIRSDLARRPACDKEKGRRHEPSAFVGGFKPRSPDEAGPMN